MTEKEKITFFRLEFEKSYFNLDILQNIDFFSQLSPFFAKKSVDFLKLDEFLNKINLSNSKTKSISEINTKDPITIFEDFKDFVWGLYFNHEAKFLVKNEFRNNQHIEIITRGRKAHNAKIKMKLKNKICFKGIITFVLSNDYYIVRRVNEKKVGFFHKMLSTKNKETFSYYKQPSTVLVGLSKNSRIKNKIFGAKVVPGTIVDFESNINDLTRGMITYIYQFQRASSFLEIESGIVSITDVF
ncbi:hypothetical protein JFN88_16970 [Paenibacillus sp. MAHUQ-46]|uniref:Uncharacterized protein n=2 Tax=Paenibacillus TaxID=44249 RepID=A0A934J4U5_9BACL|nr:hypothetical protein [Paenibacillus roseus]